MSLPVEPRTDSLDVPSTSTAAIKQTPSYILKSLFCGGIAGCAAKTAIAPLDRIKILFQTSNPVFMKYAGSLQGTVNAMRSVFSQHGFRGLYQGHSATLLRIFPYAAVKFMSYEQYKHLIMPTKESGTKLKRTLTGSLAGVTSLFFSYPMEFVRVRLAFRVQKNEQVSFRHTCVEIFREENPFFPDYRGRFKSLLGFLNFYRGFLPTVYGMIPYAGVSFLTYETLKEKFTHDPAWTKYTLETPSKNNANSLGPPRLKVWAFLLCGAVSGAIAQTSSYPFEIIRRHMQVAGVKGQHQIFSSTPATAVHIWKQRGWRGFFVGLSIGYIKVIPMFAVSFYTYEWMKHLVGI